MSGAPFRLALLEAAHDRTGFQSDSEPLNRYLREQAFQDMRRRVTACFVALADGNRIAGYYTLASASLLLAHLPASMGKKLPRYPTVPAVRMGRLAVDRSFQGQGLGGALLADALERAARSEIAAFALVVDAKEETAAAFYRHHGFIALPDTPLTLFLPLATVPCW
ncbi:GNAT family N-acetyltransferase [Acidithiobacillus sp. AMEEHan]|uniref:GNAT family N-acetyltransferase n=1 Tax=Acidithiobacillus sp. AMEEHan TaxID=2994951 RepID=UPI0027E4C8E1|nr:GNAT family N-acetyltransferase [Acidithiobacillus sp. AMEEHan]